MSQMAPPVYGSPFAYPYGSPYYYPPGNVYSDGQHYYQPPSYAYYSYPGSPPYDTTTLSAAQTAAVSPSAQSYYGAFGYPYQCSPPSYWGMTSPTIAQQASSSPASYYPPVAYSPPLTTNNVADDRSATPTPVGHGVTVTEDTLESQ